MYACFKLVFVDAERLYSAVSVNNIRILNNSVSSFISKRHLISFLLCLFLKILIQQRSKLKMASYDTGWEQPRTQAQITKNRHTTVLLYRSVAKLSERAGVLGEDAAG